MNYISYIRSLYNRGGIRVLIAALSAALIVAVYILSVSSDIYFGYTMDQGHYLVCALALSQGKGFTIISLDPPLPYTISPFLFSFLLSLIIRIAGIHIALMKTIMLSIFLLGSFCYIDMMRRRGNGTLGLLAVFLAAAAPYSLAYSQLLLTELPYTGLSLATLWAFERSLSDKRRTLCLTATAILALAAFYMRSIGITLIIALILAMFIDPRIKLARGSRDRFALAGFIAITMAGIFAWWTRCYLVRGAYGFEYLYEFLGATWEPDLSGVNPFSQLIKRFKYNFFSYEKILSQFIYPSLGLSTYSWLAGALVLVTCAIGYFHALLKHRRAHEIYIAGYLGLVLLWDFTDERFLLPLFAPLFFVMLHGLSLIGGRLSERGRKLLPVGVGVIILVGFMYVDVSGLVSFKPGGKIKMEKGLKMIASERPPWLSDLRPIPSVEIGKNFGMLPLNKPSLDLLKLQLWIRDNIASGFNFCVHYDSYFFLVTGYPSRRGFSMFSFEQGPPRTALETLTELQVDYVYTAEAQPMYSNWILEAMLEAPERFDEVARIKGTRTVLYRFQWSSPDEQD